MGLKQDIVVVNEFSVKTPDGGTRGGTPGTYVERYMARTDAVEDLAPVRINDNDSYIRKYMMRREATERMDATVSSVRKSIPNSKKLGGIAFGCTGRDDIEDISMSHNKVKRVSKDIQKQFDEGKTVLKTVLSFDPDYLKEMGIVPPDFVCERKGDYKGHVDQMKLRLAICEGINRLSRKFDDLEWIGTIQVDTKHVHCHLCMVDKGKGRLAKNGEQKGKLSETEMRILRRGIDTSLDDMQTVKMMASNVTYDRRNARCFIKKFTHTIMAKNGPIQFLLACLPEDKKLWRAGTNREEMKKANAIVREYVEELLNQPDSGYEEALRDIDKYANERRNKEDLSGRDYRRLLNNGRERLITDCMNGVYSVLRDVPNYSKRTRTPMLDVMSMSYQDMADKTSDPMVEFGFKLRSYSSRLRHHKKERQRYHDAAESYRETKEEGRVSEDSIALYNFYKQEEEYNAMLMSKYQSFLRFLPPDDKFKDEFDDILKYRHRIERLERMIDDSDMRKIKTPEVAEDYGKRVHQTDGGRFILTAPHVLDKRYEDMIARYQKKVADFQFKLEDEGLSYDVSEEGKASIKREIMYDFDDVKMLDLHHLGYDFPYDVNVSNVNINRFISYASFRHSTCMAAKQYLIDSGQEDYVSELPIRDVEVMKSLADEYASGLKVVQSRKGDGSQKRHIGRTVSLDEDLGMDIKRAVQSAIISMDIESE